MPETLNFYLLVKYLHLGCVGLSGIGFLIRGLLSLNNSSLMKLRWVRILPHINDTVLLTAAIALSAMSEQYPFVDNWLTAKVIGVCLYIALASYALGPDPRRSQSARRAAYGAALLIFGWIVSVALYKSPTGFWSAA